MVPVTIVNGFINHLTMWGAPHCRWFDERIDGWMHDHGQAPMGAGRRAALKKIYD